MTMIKTSLAAGLLGACFLAAPASAQALPPRDAAIAGTLAPVTLDDAVEMQGRRGGFRGGGGGGFRGGRGGGFRRGGGGSGAAAAAALGILGAAIIASEAARANAARDCWIQRQRVRDEWGRTIGFRRVRVCN